MQDSSFCLCVLGFFCSVPRVSLVSLVVLFPTCPSSSQLASAFVVVLFFSSLCHVIPMCRDPSLPLLPGPPLRSAVALLVFYTQYFVVFAENNIFSVFLSVLSISFVLLITYSFVRCLFCTRYVLGQFPILRSPFM